jgi:hypothetical protein
MPTQFPCPVGPFSNLSLLPMPSRVCGLLVAVFSLGLFGCGKDESIYSYDVPKPTPYAGQQPIPGDYRILGAMFPADNPIWFFKFSGRSEDVARYEAEFDKLLATVKLMPDKTGNGMNPSDPVPPQFVVPPDWTRLGERIVRREGITTRIYETLRFGPPESPGEITLTLSGGSVLDNIGRWAAQLGLPQPKVEDLPNFTRLVHADGVTGLRVDLAGPNNPAGGMRAKGRAR